ncbi:MAG: hypothetical protein AAGF25_09130 [Pseudomonadota bacterium]
MKLLSQFAIAMFGLLAGGMLLIATGLVPYWRSLNPGEFTQVFAASLPTLGGTMGILTILATVPIVMAAGFALWKKEPNRHWITAAAAATLIMLATVPLYFGAANSLLSGGTLSADVIPAELTTWGQMHWFRTIVGILGVFCAVRAGFSLQNSNS